MGYDPNFIDGLDLPLPTPSDRVIDASHTGNAFIHHSRYSLLFNEERGFAFCTAHNLDGSSLPDAQYTKRSFSFDPKIKPNSLQVDTDRGYSGEDNPWDRGHLTRRKSMSWGDEAEARIAEDESDFFSNIVPQHETLHDDAWGNVEDWMLDRVQDHGARACVFQGPVFTQDDPYHQNDAEEDPIRIPAGFWKIIVAKYHSKPRAACFLLWQRDYDSDVPLPFSPVLEQVRLTTIEVLTGLNFPKLRRIDPMLCDLQDNLRAYAARELLEKSGTKFFAARRSQLDWARDKLPFTPIIIGKDDILL